MVAQRPFISYVIQGVSPFRLSVFPKCKIILYFYINLYNIYFLKLINLFICFWLHQAFVAVCRLSLVAVSRGYSQSQCAGFSLWCLLLLRSTGSRCASLSSCGTWAQQLWLTDSRAQAQQLWHMGLVAPWHVGSSQTRAQTRVPCIGRWILNHCATREVLYNIINK